MIAGRRKTDSLPKGLTQDDGTSDGNVERPQSRGEWNTDAKFRRSVHMIWHAGAFTAEQENIVRAVACLKMGNGAASGGENKPAPARFTIYLKSLPIDMTCNFDAIQVVEPSTPQ